MPNVAQKKTMPYLSLIRGIADESVGSGNFGMNAPDSIIRREHRP
jgi:hypothetical protein